MLVWALECMVWLQRHHKGVENVCVGVIVSILGARKCAYVGVRVHGVASASL